MSTVPARPPRTRRGAHVLPASHGAVLLSRCDANLSKVDRLAQGWPAKRQRAGHAVPARGIGGGRSCATAGHGRPGDVGLVSGLLAPHARFGGWADKVPAHERTLRSALVSLDRLDLRAWSDGRVKPAVSRAGRQARVDGGHLDDGRAWRCRSRLCQPSVLRGSAVVRRPASLSGHGARWRGAGRRGRGRRAGEPGGRSA